MTTNRAAALRQVYFHDPAAPVAGAVVPSVFVAVHSGDGRLLLVRRCDSGAWELPGGRVDVGEAALQTAVREVAEESGLQVVVTGLAGVFTDPGHVVSASTGEVRQQFVLVYRARVVGGFLRADHRETCEVAWVAPAEIPALRMEPAVQVWVEHVLDGAAPLHLG
ncbi:NUDIX hydrolase [Blastococcus sp. URHD0036]|uniref:NUDIX hydrolase n=1 Tax=Blastococcus sp. URHD0036 TaxID=1380356 RepID=UPI0012DC1D1C|nr:NUDIX domain-containing protein [Blastococcus sp. URHD0036]